jgi:sugar lactone lactonase YvrE
MIGPRVPRAFVLVVALVLILPALAAARQATPVADPVAVVVQPVETLVTLTIPAEAIPTGEKVVSLGRWTWTTDASASVPTGAWQAGIIADYVLSGSFSVRSGGETLVVRTGTGGAAEQLAPETEITLGQGEAVAYLHDEESWEFRNAGSMPGLAVSAGILSTATPPAAGTETENGLHLVTLGETEPGAWDASGPVRLSLWRTVLPAGATIPAPAAGTLQIVGPDTGEETAPGLVTSPNGATSNDGPDPIPVLGLTLGSTGTAGIAVAQDAAPEGVSVVASGLINPRGFTWGEDGTLYVGLAGNGGLATNNPEVTGEVLESATPDLISEDMEDLLADDSAAVVLIEDGCPVVHSGKMPSFHYVPLGWTGGVSDVAVLDGVLYALIDGGGPSALHPDEPNGVYRIETDGSATLIANLSEWIPANPVAEPMGEMVPDGEPFKMIAHDGLLWIAESNHEQVLAVAPDGAITRVIDLSPHSVVPIGVPTGIAAAPEGGVYVGFLTETPWINETAKVIHIAEDGTVSDVWTGLTSVTAIAIGPDGALYATQMSTGNTDTAPFYRPNAGNVVRQTGPDSFEEIATGLDYPVHLDFGPDGALYVATPGIGANGGEGSIVRIDLAAAPVTLSDEGLTAGDC